MKDQINKIKVILLKELEREITLDELKELQNKYLGRKGELTQILKGIKDLAVEEKKEFGKMANQVKQELEEKFAVVTNKVKDLTGTREKSIFDASIPGEKINLGVLHPVTQMTQLIWKTFSDFNFDIALGPEAETDFYNFLALNIPEEHPARDMQDSFYLNEKYVLRTQTSTMQIHYMQTHEPPIRIVATGKCYRRDSDMTHTPMFNQFEGLMVDKDITIEHLKNVLQKAIGKILDKDLKVRFRISYFPFVEPGAEFDVSCTICDGAGCATCKQTGWLELGGCGMVHPNVLKAVGYDSDVYQGFAFGFGIERVFMMKHKIKDLRYFFENDLRFLKQF